MKSPRDEGPELDRWVGDGEGCESVQSELRTQLEGTDVDLGGSREVGGSRRRRRGEGRARA